MSFFGGGGSSFKAPAINPVAPAVVDSSESVRKKSERTYAKVVERAASGALGTVHTGGYKANLLGDTFLVRPETVRTL